MGNREKLIEQACTTFGQKGYQATSVDDLLKVTKICPSNFYYHFKSKEALAFEVLGTIFQRVREKLAPIVVNRGLSAPRKLEQIHGIFVKRMADNGCCGGCPMGNLAQELSDFHSGFREKLAEFFKECMEGIEGIVRQGVRDGDLRKDLDPRATAYLVFGSIEGLMLISKSLKELAPLKQGFRQALALLKK